MRIKVLHSPAPRHFVRVLRSERSCKHGKTASREISVLAENELLIPLYILIMRHMNNVMIIHHEEY